MKVKDPAAWLAKLDPEAIVVVHEYDGGDDAPREAEHVNQITTACVPVAEWPSYYDDNDKTDPWKPLIPQAENVVLISAQHTWADMSDGG
jgi:hypothetical protein